MVSRKTLVFSSLLALIGLGAAFLWLNFRLSKNATKVNQQVSTYSFGFEAGESLQVHKPLILVVNGQDKLSRIMARRMDGRLLAGSITRMIHEEAVQPSGSHFQLYVDLADQAVIWSPFYAHSRLNLNFAFSSNGDLSWLDQDVVTYSGEDGQVVAVRGELQLTDNTYGLISRPAYLLHLVDEVILRVDEAIRKALENPTNPDLNANP